MEYIINPPAPGENAVAYWLDAWEKVKNCGIRKIVFAPGRYDFFPEKCSAAYCYFSNNDEGVKIIAMDIRDVDGLEIAAEGAEFCFHGRISPLVAKNCRDLKISGFTVDFADSFVSDADMVGFSDGFSWCKISGKHDFQDGKLIFTGDFYDNLSGNLIFFPYDTAKGELVWDQRSTTIANNALQYRDGLTGFPGDLSHFGSKAFIIKHELRLCPGLVFDECENISLHKINLHHAAGMGILCQCCTNITVSGINIVPRSRRTGVSDDALHIVECRGEISITGSTFSGTLDDSINVHGIYRPLKCRIPGGKFYYLDSGHFQQMGIPGARPGDTLELIKNDTQKPYGKIKVKNAVMLNKAITKIEFDEAELPEEFSPGDCARVLEVADASLTIRDCRFSPLNGRGILASGLKNIHISGNTFHTAGAAVFIAGDAVYWYESGPVGNAVICENTFDNCSYRRWISSREPVGVFPEITTAVPGFCYHKNITVRDNVFISSFRNLVSMRSVENAVVCNNTFVPDDTYRFMKGNDTGYFFADTVPEQIVFLDCAGIATENNFTSKK